MAEKVKVQPVRSIQTRVRKLPSEIYQRVEPYVPKTSGEGKGIMYAAIGVGAAAGIGAVSYGLYNLIESSNPLKTCGTGTQCSSQMNTCDSELNTLVQQYTSLYHQYITQDSAQGIAMTQQQTQALDQNLAQQQAVMQSCVGSVIKTYNLDFVQASLSLIAKAVAIAITIIAGAKALSYIRSRGYMKKPPQTPGGGMAIVQNGLLDYLVSTGIVKPTWQQGGNTVKNNTSILQSQVNAYTQTLVQQNIITSEIAAAMVAADSALVAEDEALVLAVLA